VKLKPEFVDKYKEVHAKVWPEVLKQIKNSNIEDCEWFSPIWLLDIFNILVVILFGKIGLDTLC
jgi:L-rhamnose mutarotase